MRRLLIMSALVLALAAVALPGAQAQSGAEVVDLLVFTETAGFRHGSIPDGVQMIRDLVEDEALGSVDFTADFVDNSYGEGPLEGVPFVAPVSRAIAAQTGESVFTDEGLAGYDVVVWISTTGDVLDDDEQAAYERWFQAGGGYVGIHAAGDSDRAWDWYEDMSGGQFASHPPGTPEATIDTEVHAHASTSHLPARWTRVDEWYNYQRNPRSYDCYTDEAATCGVRVLMTMDESTYDAGGDAMGDHPIAWCNEWDGGVAWYTGLGHTSASYTEPAFVDHVLGGLLTAAQIDGLDESVDFAGSDVSFACETLGED